MDIIGQQRIWSFLESNSKATPTSCARVRQSNAIHVASFMDLAKKVAELQFMNRDFVLLFRGQTGDWRNKAGNTTLKPTIFRADNPGAVPTEEQLLFRYDRLKTAEIELVRRYRTGNTPGSQRLRRQHILRWSILQHYEVCETPLLDVTHSLRIAASFASANARNESTVFVLGVPNLSGAITASAEAGLQIIRLSSVCPPSAVRPHIQEGYLLGEYPEMVGMDQKQHYKHYEVDFGRRLIAKFRFEPKAFWNASADFPQISTPALYPAEDPLLLLTNILKGALV
jgi:FRG domain